MPLYQIHCEVCGDQDQIWRKVASRDENLPTCLCGGPYTRRISAPYIAPDIQPYISPGSGRVINSRAQQEYDLKATNSIINEPGLKADIARNKEYASEKAFAPLETAVDNTVRNLVNAGKLEA